MSEDITIDDTHGFKEEIEYAGFWIRLGSAIIDLLVMIPIFAISYFNQINFKSFVLLYSLTIISALYKPLMEWYFGGTLGKMANKIKVVNYDLNPISIDQGFMRYIPWGISVIFQLLAGTYIFSDPNFKIADTAMEIGIIAQNFPLSSISNYYFWVLFLVISGTVIFDKKNQGVHDKITKTFCIKVRKY